MNAQAENPGRRRRSLARRIIPWSLLAIAVLFVAIVAWGVVDMIRGPQIVEHVSPQQAGIDLPPDASDVCYHTHAAFWPCFCMEFSTSEASFRQWAEGKYGVSLGEINGPSRRMRYDHPRTGDAELATISHGLGGWKEQEDKQNGAGIGVAFDRDTGRAYFRRNFR